MVDVHHLEILWKYDKVRFAISFITAVMCVVDDTMSGLIIGSLLSMFVYLHSFSKGYVEVTMFAKGVSPFTASADAATPLDRMASLLLFSPTKTSMTTTTIESELSTPQPQAEAQAEPQPPLLVARVDVEKLDQLVLPALLDALLEKFQQDNSGQSGGNGQGEVPSTVSTAIAANVARSRRLQRDRHMPLEDVHSSMVTPILNTCHVLLYRVAGQLSYVNALAHAARASKLVELGLFATCCPCRPSILPYHPNPINDDDDDDCDDDDCDDVSPTRSRRQPAQRCDRTGRGVDAGSGRGPGAAGGGGGFQSRGAAGVPGRRISREHDRSGPTFPPRGHVATWARGHSGPSSAVQILPRILPRPRPVAPGPYDFPHPRRGQ